MHTEPRQKLYRGNWSFELVIHKIKFPQELDLLREHGVLIHKLDEIVVSLSDSKATIIPSASGSDLFELVMLGRD